MADPKRLVFSILNFLEDQKSSDSLSEEDVESIEVAKQCLESAYGLNIHDPVMRARYQVERNLSDIFNGQIIPDVATLSTHEATGEEKEEAEKLKNRGNDYMKVEQFEEALECYNKAIAIDDKNAVYFCNRAAASSKVGKHEVAIDDCNRALTIDPSYSKSYGRMGIAYTALDDHKRARECYRKAMELDPANQSYKSNLEIAETKLREAETRSGFVQGPAGGLPFDLSSIMSNPAVMNMATSMMSNPQMQQMMSNMMSGTAGGEQGQDGPPSMNSLFQVGQQLASQMRNENPELVAQLRTQMNNNTDGQTGSSDATNKENDQEPK